MKSRFALAVIAAALFLAFQLSAAEEETTKEEASSGKTDMGKVSYCIGVNIAKSFGMQGVEVDEEMLVKGIKDVLGKKALMYKEADMMATMEAFQNELREKYIERMKVAPEENKKEGEAFLAENKKKDDVETLESGLQYTVLKQGDGEKPADEDTVIVNYKGMFINGEQFDSSYDRGEPAEFQVNGVISGWTEALKLMPVGSKWKLFVPSDLAYGVRGKMPRIEPNKTLVFEIELLEIK